MKIYILNLLPINVNLHKLLNSSLQHKLTNYNELISKEDGIYIINQNKCFRIEPTFNEKYNVIKDFVSLTNKPYNLLVDTTNIKTLEVYSQLPTNYILNKITEYVFYQEQKSEIKLVLKYLENKIIDFYLLYNNQELDLSNIFIKNEINMFLSLLN